MSFNLNRSHRMVSTMCTLSMFPLHMDTPPKMCKRNKNSRYEFCHVVRWLVKKKKNPSKTKSAVQFVAFLSLSLSLLHHHPLCFLLLLCFPCIYHSRLFMAMGSREEERWQSKKKVTHTLNNRKRTSLCQFFTLSLLLLLLLKAFLLLIIYLFYLSVLPAWYVGLRGNYHHLPVFSTHLFVVNRYTCPDWLLTNVGSLLIITNKKTKSGDDFCRFRFSRI